MNRSSLPGLLSDDPLRLVKACRDAYKAACWAVYAKGALGLTRERAVATGERVGPGHGGVGGWHECKLARIAIHRVPVLMAIRMALSLASAL